MSLCLVQRNKKLFRQVVRKSKEQLYITDQMRPCMSKPSLIELQEMILATRFLSFSNKVPDHEFLNIAVFRCKIEPKSFFRQSSAIEMI